MEVGKPTAVAVGVLLVGSLVTNAYLFGRDSARRHNQPQQTVAVAQPVAGQPVAGQPVASNEPVPVAPTPVAPMPTPAPPVAVAPPPVAYAEISGSAPPSASPNSGEAAQLRDYFTRMDQLAGVNPFGNDSQGAAEKLLASAMAGDMSGFDGMIKLASDAQDKASSITPPAAARGYHEEMLSMLSATKSLLTDLRSSLKNNDAAALTSIAGSAQGLQSRANALQDKARDIKQRYGIR